MRLLAFLRKLFRWLAAVLSPASPSGPPDPTGTVRFIVFKEIRSMGKDILIGSLQLPEVPSGMDIEKQEVTVFVDGTETNKFVVGSEASSISPVEVPQDSLVKIELRYIDDAGNRSLNPLVAQQQVRDTFAPPDPTGTIGLLIVAEREGEVETPAPVEEAPAPAPVEEAEAPAPAEAATEVESEATETVTEEAAEAATETETAETEAEAEAPPIAGSIGGEESDPPKAA